MGELEDIFNASIKDSLMVYPISNREEVWDHPANGCDILYNWFVPLPNNKQRRACECFDGYPNPATWCFEHGGLRKIPASIANLYSYTPCGCEFDPSSYSENTARY